MKKISYFLATVMVLMASVTFAQKPETEKVLEFVEVMPEPPYNVYQYLAENIKYPPQAISDEKEGRVVVRFIVNKDGSISDAKVVRGFDAECDKEALRVITAMPKWKPGMQNGKAVRVYFTQPIIFRLEDPDEAEQAED